MLWALYFMQVYPGGNVGSSQVGRDGGAVDPKTWCLYLWPFIRGIAGLEMHLVSCLRFLILIVCSSNFFKIKLDHDTDNDCLMSVDGTDVPIPERGLDWYSYKFRGSGLHYEVALGIKTGDIC